MKINNDRKSIGAIKLVLLFMFTNILFWGCTASSYQNQSYDAPKQYNIEELNRYGQWVEIPTYGNVWKPFVAQDWEPFHNGHWIRSDNEWVWVSYEPFGWVVYHYGNWYDDFIQGWVWIPANTGWSPAVVQWYQKDDYICWAPKPPHGINYGEPWEEKEQRHWHVVTRDHFIDENIGELSQTHNPARNSGERNITPPSVTSNPKPDNNNQRNRATDNQNKYGNSIYVRPMKDSKSDVITRSPVQQEIENRNGRKVENVPIIKEPVKLKDGEIHRVVVQEPVRNRIEKYERNVKDNVLIRPKQQNEKEKERR